MSRYPVAAAWLAVGLLVVSPFADAQSDVKARLKAQTAPAPAAPPAPTSPAPPQTSAKNQVRAATTDDGFSRKDSDACPFLTKPSVRADGGGLNRHAGGSTLCHEGSVKVCVEGRWQIRGQCYPGVMMAHDVEHSQFEHLIGGGQSSDTGGSVGSSSGSTSGSMGGSGSAGSGQGGGNASGSSQGIVGDSDNSDIEAERRELERLQRELSELQEGGGLGAARSRTTGPRSSEGGSTSRPDNDAARVAECARLGAAISQADQQVRQLEQAARSGFGSQQVRNAISQATAYRQQLQNRSAELRCR